jgi:hypothetical protein
LSMLQCDCLHFAKQASTSTCCMCWVKSSSAVLTMCHALAWWQNVIKCWLHIRSASNLLCVGTAGCCCMGGSGHHGTEASAATC